MLTIFDLDHTVIDSSHRQATLADGSLNLAHWIENNTREKIMGDSLLPLAAQMRDMIERKKTVAICTARVLGAVDIEFLRLHGLFTPLIYSRQYGDTQADRFLKHGLLRGMAQDFRLPWARFCRTSIMLDDNKSVIEYLRGYGVRVYNAISINERLAA